MILYYLLLSIAKFCIALEDPVVYIEELGYVEGSHYRTNSGFDTSVYLGIPYALPPVGPLRFEVAVYENYSKYNISLY